MTTKSNTKSATIKRDKATKRTQGGRRFLKKEQAVIADLRDRGFAITVYTPAELDIMSIVRPSADRAAVEETMRHAAEGLAGQLRENHGHWGHDSNLPVSDWQKEVTKGETRLGYWEWVAHRRDSLIPESGSRFLNQAPPSDASAGTADTAD